MAEEAVMVIRNICAFALAALSAAPGLCGPELMNPCFDGAMKDGIAEGWQMPGKKCTVGYGYGRNGGNGLRYVGEGEPSEREWVYQVVDVQPGVRYKFEGWVRTEGICGKRGVSLQVSFYNSANKHIEAAHTPIVRGTIEDWTPLSVEVLAPKSAKTAEFSLCIGGDETGTAYFDDFLFEKVKRPPIRFFASSAYRDTVLDEVVEFRLVSNLKDAEIASRGLKGAAFVPDTSGARRLREVPVTTAPADGVWTFSIDMKGLPYGEIPVSFAIDGTNGARVATATLLMNHVRELPRRRVWVDGRGRTIVNGKPFFPLGMYTNFLEGERAEEYAKGPFNCVLPYATMSRAHLDWAEKHGLMVISSLKDHYRGFHRQPCSMADDEDELAVVSSLIATAKDHPALLAWYLNDEMGPGMIPRLVERNLLFRRLDPDHPTVSCLCRPEIARDYMPTADILSGDPYPIKGGIEPPNIARVAENTRTLDKAYFHTRPLWQVPQAFDQSFVLKKLKNDYKVRFPTKDEILNMNLQCVAEGANGLVMWAYHCIGRTALGMQDRDLHWRELCEVGETIRAMTPVFLSDDISDRVSGRRDNLPVRAWRHEGKVWVLAVNASYAETSADITVDGRPLGVNLRPLGYFFGQM